MTTQETKHETRIQPIPLEDQLGSLAESARRHLAYEALARQIATSENALQQVLDALARARRTDINTAAIEDETNGRNDRI